MSPSNDHDVHQETGQQVQPHDIRAEEELIGSILTLDKTLGAVQAEIGLKPESFYRTDHRVIFAAALELANDGKPVNELTVGNLLAKTGDDLEKAGGRPRLETLSLPSSPGAAIHFAEVVRDKARWRQRYSASQLIQAAALAEDGDRFAEAQSMLADDPTHDRAMYGAKRQQELLFELMKGKSKAEFFWPFPKLNRLQSGGMRRGQLIILSGVTNEGKSHLAAQLLDTNRKHGSVCLYDNEMDPAEQAARRASRLGDVPYGALMDGDLSQEDYKRAARFIPQEDLHWPIVDTSGWTIDEVCLHIRQYRWDFVVIDILHNFPFDNERELAASVARLKAAARLARCCIVLVAHVNRSGTENGKRRRPVRSDLKWSGEIENLSDAVCFVYRKQDDITGEPTNEGSVYFDKFRGGKLGSQEVRFNGDRLLFELPPLATEDDPARREWFT
jgi:replicative DNA helicase